MHQKVNVLMFFFNICPNRAILNQNSSLTILLSSLVFISSSPKKKSSKIYYNNISLPRALTIFYHNTSFASPTAKPLVHVSGYCRTYITSFGGPRPSWSLRHSFRWCKPKWSQDDFNSQSNILQGLGTTSWSTV